MRDVNGKEIAGYRTPLYWFGLLKGRIQGMSGVSYASEAELLTDYDASYGDHVGNPPLFRVYADGSEVQLRPKFQEEGE